MLCVLHILFLLQNIDAVCLPEWSLLLLFSESPINLIFPKKYHFDRKFYLITFSDFFTRDYFILIKYIQDEIFWINVLIIKLNFKFK